MSGSLRSEIQTALAGAGLAPLHRFGQNFMVDGSALDCLCRELDVAPGARVVEVGPGTGVLTQRLIDAGGVVLAVEIDRGLAGLVEQRFAGQAVTLVHGDCLESKSVLHPAIVAFAAAGPWRLGANLPYDVALPVLLNAVALPRPPERMVVTVQWEAAERLCSRPGSDAWGASAAVLQAAAVCKTVRRLPPQCFYPQPRVDSAMLRCVPRTEPLPTGFGRWCRMVFSARRKVLTRALRDQGVERDAAAAACQTCGLDPERRLEALDAPELVALFLALGGGTDAASIDQGTPS